MVSVNLKEVVYVAAGVEANVSFMIFALKVLFIYNGSIPAVQNKRIELEKAQQDCLNSSCNFLNVVNVTIESIVAPFEKIVTISLVTSGKKKRQVVSDCTNYVNEFNQTCLKDLTSCNQTGLITFLDKFINNSVTSFLK